jgi:starvation-inducible DNA-binding protein
METATGITSDNRAQVAHSLNRILADEHVLYIKTRNAHWNVEGPDFYAQHKFFEDQYHQLEEVIDDVAERIRSIGHYAVGSMQKYLQLTHLSEQPWETNNSAGFIKELLEDHQTIIMHLREHSDRFATEWKDLGTSDFVTGIMEAHEKMAWMLRAHLK